MAKRSMICFDRTNESLCDVEIIAGTGTEDDDDGQASPILATKVFLHDISHKWKELIQSASKTVTKVSEPVKDKVFVPQIPREIMEHIIDFVYAGLRNEIQPLPLDDENAGKYFEAAKFLEMEDIEAECLKYFDSKIITLENFPVLFKWSSTFGNEATQPKMRAFLTQNSQQIPEIIRRCKNELKIPEAEIALILIDWISFCSSGGENCDLSVKQVIRQFSNKNEKSKLLKAFFKAGNLEWKETAFDLLQSLYENQDRDSDSNAVDNGDLNSSSASNSTSAQHPRKVQNPTGAEHQPSKSKTVSSASVKLTTIKNQSKSTARKSEPKIVTVSHPRKSDQKSTSISFSRTPSKKDSSKSGPSSNSNASGCQEPSTSKSSASPVKRRKKENGSSSSWNSLFVELERVDSPEQQEQETQVELDSDSDDSSSSSSSSSSCSSDSSTSSSSSNASETRHKITLDKKKKLAQNSNAQGIFYFLLKNQKSPGGFHFWSFDFKTKKSGQEAQLPPCFRDRQNLAMIYWKKTIYFMGGESARTGRITKQVYAFDLKSEKWTKMEMLDPRSDFGACVLNGNIYAVGGCEESPCGPKSIAIGINTVEKLSLAPRKSSVEGQSPKFKEIDCMESCRAHAGIVALQGKIYAIGGEVWNDKVGKVMSASELCEVFDPKICQPQDQWNPIAPMKYKRLGLAAVATTEPHPNRIYALGGTVQSQATKKSAISLDTVEIYNPDGKSWENGPPMKKPRKFFSAVYFNNCIYALGGDSETQPTIEKFDLGTKNWTLEGDLKKEGNFTTLAFESL